MEQELQDRSRPSTVCAICIRSDAYIDGIRQHRFLSILSRLPSVFPLSLPRKSHPPTRETHPTIRVQRFAVVVSLDPANPSPTPSPLTTTMYYYHYYYEYNEERSYLTPRNATEFSFDNWRFDIREFFFNIFGRFARMSLFLHTIYKVLSFAKKGSGFPIFFSISIEEFRIPRKLITILILITTSRNTRPRIIIGSSRGPN